MNHAVQARRPLRPARPRFLPSPLAAALALAFAAGPAIAQLPTGAAVVSGSASIATDGARMTISNSPNAIINWQSFSVGSGQSVRFDQPSAASQVLNRVVGNDPSQLLGTLSSNGKVWLINPSGVLFGQGARIDVAGLVASTLGISDADFLAGRMKFDGSATGRLLNQGEIRTPEGGSVWLIGTDVINEGLIATPGGEIILAAGRSVELVDSSAPRLKLKVTAPSDQALNLGQLIAQRGSIELQGAIVNQQGLVRADGAGIDAAGRVVLRAQRDLTLGAGSVTSASASGSGRGGEIVAQSESGTTLVAGRVEAVSADGAGGRIALLGPQVGVTGSVDASGAAAGGELLVGGDYQGGNPAIPNSRAAYVGAGATLRADATRRGDGGKLIVWGDDATRVHGSLSARGGAQGGNGGLVETSGHFLDVAGARVTTAAPKGAPGQWLLDPYDLQVQHGSATTPPSGGSDVVFESTDGFSTVYDADISDALTAGSNVTLRTGGSGGTDLGGNLTVSPGVQITHAGSQDVALKLDAYRNISLLNDSIAGGASITATGTGRLDVDLNADMLGASANQGRISLAQSTISTNGGALRLYGQSNPGSGFARGVSITNSTTIDAGAVSIASQGSSESAGIAISNSTINATDLSLSGSASLTGIVVRSSGLNASGKLTASGRADSGTDDDFGVFIDSSTLSGRTGVDVAGQASGFRADGAYLYGSRIESQDGAVNIRGISAATDTSAGAGLYLGDTAISGRDGVDLRGRSAATYGVFLYLPTIASSAGAVRITGEAAGASNTGLTIMGGTVGGPQQSADIVLRARNSGNGGDSISLAAAGAATRIQTQGSVVLLPGGLNADASAIVDADDLPITINSPSPAGGFNVGADDLLSIQPQTGSVVFGSDSHYGKITLAGAGSFGYDLTLQNRGISPAGANAGIDVEGAQLIGRTLTLASRGPVQQLAGGPVIADRLLVLSDSAAPVSLTSANWVGTLAVDGAASLSFENTGDLILGPVSGKLFAPAKDAVLTATSTASSAAGNFSVHATGALTLAQQVASTDPAATITLAAGGNFSSSGGSLQPAGRFLVYDGDGPANTNLGGVNHDFLQFDSPYPASPAQSGSGLLYATPLSLSLHYSRPYDGSNQYSIDSPASLRVDSPAGYGVSRVDSPGYGYFDGKNVTYNQPLSPSMPPTLGLTDVSGKPVYYSTNSGFVYSGDITPRPLTLSATAADKVYDGNRAASVSGASLGGAVSGDDIGVTGLVGQFETKTAGVNKGVTVSGGTLAGVDAGNYALDAAPVMTSATITPRPVSVEIVGEVRREYDSTANAALSAANYALHGRIAGDQVLVSGPAQGRYDNPAAGTQKPVTADGPFALSGADAVNYVAAGAAQGRVGTITPAPLLYQADPAQRYSGQTISGLSGRLVGFRGADDAATQTSGTLSWSTSASELSPPGSYPVQGGGLSSANYMLSQAAGNASALTLVADDRAGSAAQDAAKAADLALQEASKIAASFPLQLPAGGVIDFSALPETAAGVPGPDYFAPINVAGMAPADLTRLLESRREFKRKLFADAITRLDLDPGLADVQPCESAAQADSGSCRITPEQVAELQAAKAPQQALHAAQAALPAIRRKFALFFGLNDYQDRRIPQLESAIPDVDAVSRVFAERLGYEVRVVRNPAKAEIVRALNQLSAEAASADSVVIYYAGHGYSLEKHGAGYWIPSDAPIDDAKRWISTSDVSRLLAAYRPMQVALISDSCYSGAFAREGASGIGQASDAADVLSRRSVVVLSSGGDEPVFDEGKEGHSIFAWNLMQSLAAVSGWTPGAQVFNQVRSGVSKEFPQTPQYGAVSAAGHQPGGEYLFEVR